MVFYLFGSKIILFGLKFFLNHELFVLSSGQDEEWDTASVGNEDKNSQDLAVNCNVILGIVSISQSLGQNSCDSSSNGGAEEEPTDCKTFVFWADSIQNHGDCRSEPALGNKVFKT